MRRLLIYILIYIWGLNIAGPWVYYQLFGYVHIYTAISICPNEYYDKVALIGTAVIGTVILVLALIDKYSKRIAPSISIHPLFWYLIIAVKILPIIQISLAGDNTHEYMLSGNLNGTLYAYVNSFINIIALLFIFLFCNKKKYSVLWVAVSYVLMSLVFSSRQGVLIVAVVLVLYWLTTQKGKEINWKKYIVPFCLLLISAPVLYVLSTNSRHGAKITNASAAIEQIVGRCSSLELSGIALYKYESGLYNEELFIEKYGVENQTKLVINSLFPGSVWENDVDPNQYYRAVFGIATEENCRETYTSINMLFPIYMIIKYDYFTGIFFSICIILLFCLVVMCVSNWKVFAIPAAYLLLTSLINMFDWVYYFRQFQSLLLTCITTYLLIFLSKYVNRIHIKRKRYKFRKIRVSFGR